MEEAGLRLVAENEAGFKSAMQNAQGAVDRFTGDLAGPQTQRISGFQAAMTGAFTAVASAAIEMAAQATQAISGFVTDGIEAAGNFEQSLSVLKATAGATDDEMQAVSEMAFQLGNDMSLPASSATDASDAILELVKSGLSLKDAMAAAKGTLLLATAAETDAGNAAQITAGILNAFNMEGEEAAKIVDMLAAAAGAGAGEISDYALGFQQAGGLFFAAGQDADALAASLQVLIKNGMTGSDAGTALKNTMMALQKPTDQAAKLMESLGVNVYDSQGNMKPFNQIIGIFNEKMFGMTQEQKNAALGTIFLSDGMKAMIPLLNEGQAAFEARTKAVNESGKAQELANAQTEGFKGAQAALANAVETLQLAIGMKLLPVLTELFTNVLAPAVNTLMQVTDAFFAAGGGADLLVQTVSGFFEMMTGGGGDVDMFYQPLIGLMEAFGMTDEAIDGALDAVDMFVGAISTMVQSTQVYINALQAVIFAVFGEIQKFIDAHGEEIMAIFQQAWEVIQLAIQTAAMYYEKVLAPTLNKIAKWISDHSDEIQAVFTTVWNIISGVIRTVLAIITGVLKAAMQLMQGDTEGAMETIKNTFITIWNKIRDAIEAIVNNLAQGLRQKFEEIKSGITGAIQSAYDAVKKTLEGWLALGSSIITNIIDGIKSQAQALLDQIRGVITGAIRAAINLFPEFLRGPLYAFFGISANSAQGFKGAGVSGYSNYGNNTYYSLNLTTTTSPNVVMDSFAVMQAFG
jgi:TP901 family phage tail tape measure protein